MSVPVVVLLDRTTVSVLRARASTDARTSESPASVPWDPQASAAEIGRALAPLRGVVGTRARLAVVVGLGLLDVAQPELPPVSAPARHALLLRDADRYFPIEGAAAVALTGTFAFAAHADGFEAWMQALSALGRVETVINIADALQRGGANGSWDVPAGIGESAYVTIDGGAVRDVRRLRELSTSTTSTESARRAATPYANVARGAREAVGAPLHTMLVDSRTARRIASGRRWKSAQRVAAAILVVALLAWSADRWRARQLEVADAELARLTRDAVPAQTAAARLQRAQTELSLLAPSAGTTAAAVIARLGAVLPRDAFVQRLEWDGSVWRIDGSALSAPGIVPVLDGDAMFSDVRIVAASTRFMDQGRTRESFSISFRTRAAGGASGTP